MNPRFMTIASDLLNGGRHSRQSVAALGVSLPTADRWLVLLLRLPGVVKVKSGKTSWLEWRAPAWMVNEARKQAKTPKGW